MTNKSRTLYTGVTNDLERRVDQHKRKQIPGFTAKYNITRLVYYEAFGDIRDAIAREKQIKGWLRSKKITLIESRNRHWHDLSADWYSEPAALPGTAQERAAPSSDASPPHGREVLRCAQDDKEEAPVRCNFPAASMAVPAAENGGAPACPPV